MLRLKKFICLFLLIFLTAGCQKAMTYDKEWAVEFVENQVQGMKGYRLEGAYFYQGEHLKVNEENIGEGVVVKAVICYYDIFKDPNKHELITVLDERNNDLVVQGYIYGENEDVLLGVDPVAVYDANRPVKYLKAMSEHEIREFNRKLNTIEVK